MQRRKLHIAICLFEVRRDFVVQLHSVGASLWSSERDWTDHRPAHIVDGREMDEQRNACFFLRNLSCFSLHCIHICIIYNELELVVSTLCLGDLVRS